MRPTSGSAQQKTTRMSAWSLRGKPPPVRACHDVRQSVVIVGLQGVSVRHGRPFVLGSRAAQPTAAAGGASIHDWMHAASSGWFPPMISMARCIMSRAWEGPDRTARRCPCRARARALASRFLS